MNNFFQTILAPTKGLFDVAQNKNMSCVLTVAADKKERPPGNRRSFCASAEGYCYVMNDTVQCNNRRSRRKKKDIQNCSRKEWQDEILTEGICVHDKHSTIEERFCVWEFTGNSEMIAPKREYA